MGIYIKGMSKPKSCKGCYFNGSNLFCLITRGNIDRDDYTCEIDCPLVEVKTPHGRLVDTTTAYQDTIQYGEHFRKSVLRIVNDLPTVIEREE